MAIEQLSNAYCRCFMGRDGAKIMSECERLLIKGDVSLLIDQAWSFVKEKFDSYKVTMKKNGDVIAGSFLLKTQYFLLDPHHGVFGLEAASSC